MKNTQVLSSLETEGRALSAIFLKQRFHRKPVLLHRVQAPVLLAVDQEIVIHFPADRSHISKCTQSVQHFIEFPLRIFPVLRNTICQIRQHTEFLFLPQRPQVQTRHKAKHGMTNTYGNVKIEVVKSVKYMLYWEFDTKENYGIAQKNLYGSYWKAIEKCLIVPHDKYLGEVVF